MKMRTSLLACLPLLFTAAAVPAQDAATAARAEWKALIDENFEHAATQYAHLLEELENRSGLPRSLRDEALFTVPPEDWTSGFFPGALWLVFEHTNDPQWREAAEDYTQRVERIQHFTGHHDIGFMLGCSFGEGLRLTGQREYRDVLLQGARSLASRFSPEVGAIRSWDFGSWGYPVIVDNMMNLELLTWAAEESGDESLREIAIAHADKTLEHHFREDASSYHVVDYDPQTGEPLHKQTAQGYADHTAWARGQSWALYGYSMMYRETREPRYLEMAVRIADFLIHHPNLPADRIPYWDYDAPDIPDAPRDSSAGAIMCAALLELSGFVPAEKASDYREVALAQVRSLSSPAYRSEPGANGGFILKHGVGHIPEDHEVDVPLIYGDYYFLEALQRLRDDLALTYP
ncbi:MAG: glycoside hydrolase family 88 protein [Verrucomicrobiota bacterium]